MAAFTVPGLKASKGQTGFVPLEQGDYEFKCKECTVGKDPKQPAQLWTFKFEVLAGPPQADGSSARGKMHTEWVRILDDIHPNFKPEWSDPKSGKTQMGVDQLKSMVLAMGVSPKGDNLDPGAFQGMTCKASIVKVPSKTDREKFFTNTRNWAPRD
jgi:hypothetical protein